MATRTECPLYDQCGFVKWRVKRPDGHILPLPENGDCGKVLIECGRYDNGNPLDLATELPITYDEMVIALPKIPNTNGRPERRLVGGGHS